MFQRDYITKVIEEMSQIPARVLGFRLEKKLELANLALDDYYRTYLKTDRANCLIPPGPELQKAYNLDFGQIEPFSTLLTEEAEMLLIEGKKDQDYYRLKKALEFLEYVQENEKINYSHDRIERIKMLQLKLRTWK
jgi:hypothetical protein